MAGKTSSLLLLIAIACCQQHSQGQCPKRTLNILAFVPCYDDTSLEWSDSQCDVFVYSAAQLAADHINTHPSVLSNVELQLLPFEERHDPYEVLFNALPHLNAPIKFHGVIGPSSSSLAHHLVPLFNKMDYPVVSYGAHSVNIKGKSLFSKTIPSGSFLNEARVKLLEMYKWYKIGILISDSQDFRQESAKFRKKFLDHFQLDVELHLPPAYSGRFTNNETLHKALTILKQRNVAIILGFFDSRDAALVLCMASHMGLTSTNHVWILPSYFDPNWWKHSNCNCMNEEMRDTLQSVISIGSAKYPPFNSSQDESPAGFKEALIDKTLHLFPSLDLAALPSYLLHSQAVSAYDSVWVLASVWDKVLSKGKKLCSNRTALVLKMNQVMKHVLRDEISLLSPATEYSEGCYGQIQFSQYHDDVECPVAVAMSVNGSVTIRQLEDGHPSSPQYQPDTGQISQWMRNFSAPTKQACPHKFKWKGGQGTAPSSGFSLETSEIDTVSFVLSCVLVSLVVVLMVTLVTLNLIWRKNKHIRVGGVRLNIMVIILTTTNAYLPIIFALVNSAEKYNIPTPIGTDILCWLIGWSARIGNVLILSTLLAKNYRIYRVFHSSILRSNQIHHLTDGKLSVFILLSVLPMMLILTVNMAVDIHKCTSIIIRKYQDQYDYHFLKLYTCKRLLPELDISRLLYVATLTAFLLFFSIQNMNLASRNTKFTSRYSQDGRITTITIFIMCIIYGVLGTGIYVAHQNPLSYKISYWMVTALSTLHSLTVLAVLYLWKFWLMYKDRKKSVLQRRRTEEQLQQWQRFYSAKLQATQLRNTLAEIQKKIENLRQRRQSTSSDLEEMESEKSTKVHALYLRVQKVRRSFKNVRASKSEVEPESCTRALTGGQYRLGYPTIRRESRLMSV